MTRLSINLNKIALLRNQRDGDTPSVLSAAKTIIQAGAEGITVHPRPDQRHIRPADVHDLSAMLRRGDYHAVEFNIEGNPFIDYLPLVETVVPDQATFVPDGPDARTSEAGWSIEQDGHRLKPVIQQLRDIGIRVSLFMEPDPDTIGRAADVGANRVELYTGPYAEMIAHGRRDEAIDLYAAAASAARASGLGLNAGHDLSLDNLDPLIKAIPDLAEVSIGHAFTADALWMGLAQATRAYKRCLG